MSNFQNPKPKQKIKKRPFCDMNIPDEKAIPRTLDVLEFVKAKSDEIKYFTNQLKNAATSSNRRAFQTLPRHMRRRAMSHNPHRLPRNLRKKAEQEQSNDIKSEKKSRKSKRKPRNALLEYQRKNRKFVWLETHIWHAKRMHMRNMWGHRLAYTPADKSSRAVFKSAAHLCTISDVSYFSCVEVSGTQEEIIKLMGLITNPNDWVYKHSRYTSGGFEGEITLYKKNLFPFGCIGLVRFCWNPIPNEMNTNRKLWLWTHPSITKCILDTISEIVTSLQLKVSFENLSSELIRFELRGGRCNEILKEVLKPVRNEKKSEDSTKVSCIELWENLKNIRSPSILPKGYQLCFDVELPSTKNVKQRFRKWEKSSIKKGFVIDKIAKSGDIEEQERDKDVEQINLKDVPVYEPIPTIRLRELMNSTSNIQNSDSLWDSNSRRKIVNINKEEKETKIEVEIMPNQLNVPIMMIVNGDGGFGSGWDVVLPAGIGLNFWISCHFAGGRAIGFKDRRILRAEHSIQTFPEDFPDSEAGFELEMCMEKEKQIVFDRKPPSKREKYECMKVKRAFAPDWKSLFENDLDFEAEVKKSEEQKNSNVSIDYYVLRNFKELLNFDSILKNNNEEALKKLYKKALIPILIEMKKGVPSTNAIISLPTSEEVTICCKKGDSFKLEERQYKGKKKNNAELIFNYLRETIGFVTLGRFSFWRGKGYGFGFVSITGMKKVFDVNVHSRISKKNQEKVVLVRNTNSLAYRPAKISLFTDNIA